MTKWNELKVKIQMLSKGEQLILLFICAFVVALFPGERSPPRPPG